MEKFLKLIILIFFGLSFIQCEKPITDPPLTRIPIQDGLKVLLSKDYIIDAHDKNATGYYWDDGHTSYGKTISSVSEHMYSDTGSYRVVVHYATDSIVYRIYCVPSLLLYIPNSFSPNGTGPELNNTFKIDCNGFASFNLKIFDMDFVLLYKSDDYKTHGWNGTNETNQHVPIGSYIYQLAIEDLIGEKHAYQGVLHLIN